MKFKFIDDHRSTFRVEKMCSVLGVSKSGYYKWRLAPPSERKKRREVLTKEIEAEFLESDRNYGSPKITEEL
ncbi:IS3 family transposase, partial [Paenibacillus qinlingensis]|nr:IS3 family transposase [Paenibacillus qinlingensis]